MNEFFGEIGDQLSEGALDLIRGAGVAVLDATQATYTLAASIVAPRRVEAVAVADLILEQVSEAKFSIQRIARNIQRIAIRLTRSESSMESSSRPTLPIRVGQDSWLVDFTDYVSVHPTFGRVRPSTPRFRPYSFLSLSLSDYTPRPVPESPE